ncbi:MAG TPA: glycosyltransferase, partial [Gemmatirosa sp.]
MSTYNRAALLGDAVRSLLALDPATPPYEVVIVDNNSTDDTRAVVEALIPESGGRLRYVFEGRQGVAYGRNTGAAVARAPVIVFTDDDVRASPGWLVAYARAFAEHPEVDYAGGPVKPMWPKPAPAWLTHAHSSPLALIEHGAEGFVVTRENFCVFVTANLAVRRDAFEAVGRLDPKFQHEPGAVTAIEDHELQIRLQASGRRGWYEPEAVIRAEVQANRLTKAYHRRWAFDHGRVHARVAPPGHQFDGSCTFTPEPPGARKLLGAPLWMYRQAAESGVRAL